MTAIPVPSSATPGNPTLRVAHDRQNDLSRRVGKLERPTNNPGGGGFVTHTELEEGLAGKAPAGLSNSALLDWGSIPAGELVSLTMTVVGAVLGDTVAIGAPSTVEPGLIWSGFVSAPDVVRIRLHNATALPIDPVPNTWKASIIP